MKPPCEACGHGAWPHGNQTGFPPIGAPCHAAMPDGTECPCPTGYSGETSPPTSTLEET